MYTKFRDNVHNCSYYIMIFYILVLAITISSAVLFLEAVTWPLALVKNVLYKYTCIPIFKYLQNFLEKSGQYLCIRVLKRFPAMVLYKLRKRQT